MIDVLEQIDKRLKRFRGWVPDVDPRDVGEATENTFSELIGYDPLRIPGILSKDFGYSAQYSYPGLASVNGVNVTADTAVFRGNMVGWTITANGQTRTITAYVDSTHVTVGVAFNPNFSDSGYVLMPDITVVAHQSFFISDLAQEYTVIAGVTAGKLRLFMNPFYNGSTIQGWTELTEYLLNLTVDSVDTPNKTITVVTAVSYPANHFKNFAIQFANGKKYFCLASVETSQSPFKQKLTVVESNLSAVESLLPIDADVSNTDWSPSPIFSHINAPTLAEALAPGSTYGVRLGTDHAASPFEVTVDFLGTPYAITPLPGGKTRVYYAIAYSGSRQSSATIGLYCAGVLVKQVDAIFGWDWTQNDMRVFEVDNSAINAGYDPNAWRTLSLIVTGTTSPASTISLAWMQVRVDNSITTVGQLLNLYRFPITQDLLSAWAGYGATPYLLASKGKNKLLLGSANSSAVQQVPLTVHRVNRKSFITQANGGFARSYDGMYLEAQSVDRAYSLRGIALSRGDSIKTGSRVVVVPILDGYQLGDPIYNGVGNSPAFTMTIDWALFDKRITGFVVFYEWVDPSNRNVEDFDRVYLASVVVPLSGQKDIDVVSIANGTTIWTILPDNKISISFSVQALIKDANNVPITLSLNQYRGASHTTGATNWRYRLQMAKQQQSLVAVDESDDVIRLSYYDTFKIHEDDVFPNVGQDKTGTPTIIFLANEGPLLGLAELNGLLYAFKQTQIQETDLVRFSSRTINSDCVSKRGIKSTSLGIVYVGQNNIYLIPKDGGPIEFLNRDFADTFRAIPLIYKQSAITEEARLMDSIVVSLQDKDGVGVSVYTQYIFNTRARIWWKRKFSTIPTWMSVREDGTMEFTDGKRIYKYPDRTTYSDLDVDGIRSGQAWEITTQWLDLGAADVMKTIRTVAPVIIATAQRLFQIEVYFDRSASPFDTLYGTTVNGIFELAMPLKVPNLCREFRLRIVPKAFDPMINTAGKMDLSELRVYGETSGSRGDR